MVIIPVALGLQNSIYCGIIMADINKITFVFPQPFVNNEKEKKILIVVLLEAGSMLSFVTCCKIWSKTTFALKN
jgi:hypothetical protein